MTQTTSKLILCAIVVTHDRPDQLSKNLTALFANDVSDLAKVVVVDNSSSQETSILLDGISDDRLTVLRPECNIGGAGGFDLGMRYAIENVSADWVVVMDDDARPFKDAIKNFWSANPDKRTVIASAVYYPDGSICEMNRPSINPFWNTKVLMRTFVAGRSGYHISDQAFSDVDPISVDLSSFVGMFIPSEIINEIGYPDPKLFIYGDDVLYSLRIREAGYEIKFHPDIEFTHDCSTFKMDKKRAFSPLWKVYYAYRNGIFMYRKAAKLLFWLFLPLLITKWTLAGSRYGDQKSAYYRLMRQAVWDGILSSKNKSHQDVLDIQNAE